MEDVSVGGSSKAWRPAYWSSWVRYRFDNALSRGPWVVVGWLGLVSLFFVLATTVVLAFAGLTGVMGEGKLGFGDALWHSLLRMLGASDVTPDTGLLTRIAAIVVTILGIFVGGSLIGLIATAVDQRIEALRKGRSAVLESDHTVILGWSPRVASILRELIVANESRTDAVVVVLSETDKDEMEDALRGEIQDFKTTRLVCRNGTSSSPADLQRINIRHARSIIVIGDVDSEAVKALLAIRVSGSDAPIVVEMGQAETAVSVRALFGTKVATIDSETVVAELTAQACRQGGLSQVFRELLDFDGDELYFSTFPELAGNTYAEAQLAFRTSAIVGVYRSGDLLINPDRDLLLVEDDQLIGIASDDSTFVVTHPSTTPRAYPAVTTSGSKPQRRIILVGWSRLGPRVVHELDRFGDAETTIEVLVGADIDVDQLQASLPTNNLTIKVSQCGQRPETLASFASEAKFDEVIVLGNRDALSSGDADALTLLTLLAFHQAVEVNDFGSVRIVAELLEQRHGVLAHATGVDDFIVSDELTSLMIAQVSERNELATFFQRLFEGDGATIEVVPADSWGAASCRNFGDIVASASMQTMSAFGYRRAIDGAVVLNPDKDAPLELTSADGVVVVRSVARSTHGDDFALALEGLNSPVVDADLVEPGLMAAPLKS